jgi:hypothetical protein
MFLFPSSISGARYVPLKCYLVTFLGRKLLRGLRRGTAMFNLDSDDGELGFGIGGGD